MDDLISRFINEIDNLNGLYLDSISGFSSRIREIELAINKLANDLKSKGQTVDQSSLVKTEFHVKDNREGKSEDSKIHSTTLVNLKKRTAENGTNYILIGNLCIAQIYQLWEKKYRSKLAMKLGVDKNSLTSDLFGDLRLLRHSILHHEGIALDDITKTKIIQRFKPGDQISFTRDQFQDLIDLIKSEIKNFDA